MTVYQRERIGSESDYTSAFRDVPLALGGPNGAVVLFYPARRLRRQAREHVLQVDVRIVPVELGRVDQTQPEERAGEWVEMAITGSFMHSVVDFKRKRLSVLGGFPIHRMTVL